MRRRTKVLVYAWLLSWVLVGSAFLAEAWACWLGAGTPDVEPGRYASYVESVEMDVWPLVIATLAAGPLVYLSWRIVDRCVAPEGEAE